MKKLLNKRLLTVASFVLINAFLVSCEKDARKPKKDRNSTTTTQTTTTTTTSPTPTTNTSTSPAYSLNVNWNNRANASYGYTEANQDFTNVHFWGDASRSHTVNGTLRTTMLKNLLGGEGGVISRVNVPDGSEYQLQFDMMFDNNFDFSYGGKVGFGFLIGEGYTGGGNATDGNGGSARLMWQKSWDGRVYLKPYLYYKDQPGTWGNDFGKAFPSSGSLQKGTWYTVKIYAKSNNGYNTDGHIRMVVNGTTLMDQAIRWTTNDTKRLINNVSFENFRGGSESYWQSSTDGYIFFDNVSWSMLSQ